MELVAYATDIRRGMCITLLNTVYSYNSSNKLQKRVNALRTWSRSRVEKRRPEWKRESASPALPE